ncbi:MAG: ATP-binding protein, partial [Bradymonadaceae bacterium]|nr:ATP-binding protein [Lujinxingiaceae bacterium]
MLEATAVELVNRRRRSRELCVAGWRDRAVVTLDGGAHRRIVNRRYHAQKSIALTTNLAFKDWGQVFPNATCTVALVDRLCH